jgi:glycosyltransferase involved in cell wall biosynthesis
MQIYFYLKHFPLQDSPFSEGVTKAVHGLACGLIAQGRSVTILGEGPDAGGRRSEYGYEIRVFPAANTHPSFKLSPELKTFLSTQLTSVDRVILNGIFHRSVYAVSKQLKRLGIPYVVAPHDPYHPAIFQKNKLVKTVYWHLKESRMLRSASGIQVLDHRHIQWLTKRGIHTPAIALPNGFEPQDVIPAEKLVWQIHAVPQLYFLGRLDAYNKGLDLLLEAVADLVRECPLSLTLQGPDWGDRALLISQVERLGIQKYVTFLDPDFGARSAELAMGYDVFCVPSRFEGFSLSALEAMLAGRVVLISTVAGLAPYIEACDAGAVVEPTVAGIRSGLCALFDRRDEWQTLGLAGRAYALQQLRWESIAEAALAFYREIG